jgi:GDP-4-dehydro-6-deoxy-D-mannose reductase
MSRRALITGAEGFVGQHLRAHLESRDWDVVGASLRGVAGTIGCDITAPASVEALLDTAGEVTHVFHLAGVAFVPQAVERPNLAFDVNLEGTVNVLAALRARDFPGRILNIGSAAAYGAPSYLPIDEAHPFAPLDPYGISKAAGDFYCDFARKTQGLDIVRLRPFNHSGPGQQPSFVLPAFARQLVEIERGAAEPIVRVGNLEARRDFSHVADVVHAYEMAALHGKSGAAYNVCSGEAVAVGDVLDRLVARSHVEVLVETDPARMRPVDVPEIRGTYAALEADTGWKPVRTMDQLLDDLLDSWRAELAATHGGGAREHC